MSDRFPQDAWYAVGGSVSLRAGDVIPVRLFGEERIAWRANDGGAHVWDNRCVHRGMRLQYGFVDGDRLACRYHGWRFGGDGKCAMIPAHPDMTPPADYCIAGHPSAETAGLVWTSVGSPKDGPPDLSEFANLAFCRTVTINALPSAVDAATDGMSVEPFDDGKMAPGQTPRRLESGIIAIDTTSDAGEQTLVLALQPVSDAATQVHVLVNADVIPDDVPALRRHYANWARRFRWQVENAFVKEAAA